MHILPLGQVSLGDTRTVGRKAAVAGELAAAGFPVPAGLCLTVGAFQAALQPLASDVRAALSGLAPAFPGQSGRSLELAELLARLKLPAGLLSELWQQATLLQAGSAGWAVRSSAVDEDAPDASLAGLYTSVLGVRTPEALEAAILTCWRSYFGPGALALRQKQRSDDSAGMGVLIQPLVEAECGGVCYSLDPVRPASGRVLINAAWGLPAGVVDGTALADTLWVDRDRMVVSERRVVEKPTQIGLGADASLATVPTSAAHARAGVLPDSWAIRVAQFGLAAEALLGTAQDIEWAIAAGQIWLLQSRPIASLPPELLRRPFPIAWDGDDERRRLWLRSQPSGREQDVLVPLELDEMAQIEAMRDETCRLLGADMNRSLKVVNGRAYLAYAPPSFSPGDRRLRRQAWQDLDERLAASGLTGWDHWGPEIVRASERLAAFDTRTADGPELAQHLEDALAIRRRHSMLHPLCSKQPPGDGFVDALARVSGLSGDAARAIAYQLIRTGDSVLVRLEDDVYELACLAREDEALASLLANPVPPLWERLAALPGAGHFRRQLEHILARYGDRNGGGYGSEATVATPTWREQPEAVLHLAAVFLPAGRLPPQEARRRAAAACEARIDQLCATAGPETAAELRHHHRRACRLAEHLEEHNHYIDQLSVGQLRRAVLAAAGWLVGHGRLAARDDIFWLRFDEIAAALREPDATPVTDLIPGRRAAHAEWSALKAPALLGLPEARLPDRPPLADDIAPAHDGPVAWVSGQGVSAGRGRGPAKVAVDAGRLPDLQPGDVLVAPNVGPLWALYVPILAGLVLDAGGPGQHAAAVAREYGVPAVVGTGGATRQIPEGAQVIVDGSAGRVEVVD